MKWQPIETAPTDGTRILLCGRDGKIADGHYGQPDGFANPKRFVWPYIHANPTHWAPLALIAAAQELLDAEIGRKWHADSSLETWFPYTAEELTRLRAELAAERARGDAAVAEAAEHKMFQEESARRLKEVQADRDRLRAAGRSLLACPHIAERDTDPDWVDAETEAAVAEMRDALGGEHG